MRLQGPKCYIPLKSACSLFVTYYREFHNRESKIARWIFSPRWKRTLKISHLTLSWRRTGKLMDWFLYDNGLHHERVNSLKTGGSFENLSHLSSCSLSQRWRFQRKHSNVSWGIDARIGCTKLSGSSPNIFYGLEAYGTH